MIAIIIKVVQQAVCMFVKCCSHKISKYCIVPGKCPWVLAVQTPNSRAVTQRRCLNGSTIPMQGPTPDAKLAAMGQNQLASSVHPCFIEASPTVEMVVSCYKADWLIASLLSFHTIQLSLAVHEFRAAGEERCEQGNRWLCVNLWCPVLWRPKHIRTIASMWVSGPTFRFITQTWWAVTQRTLKKHKTVKIGGWALAWVWVLSQDNTVSVTPQDVNDRIHVI